MLRGSPGTESYFRSRVYRGPPPSTVLSPNERILQTCLSVLGKVQDTAFEYGVQNINIQRIGYFIMKDVDDELWYHQ